MSVSPSASRYFRKALPEILAEREQEHRDGDGDDVALEPERIDDA